MKKVISVNAFSDSETAQYRLKVINYYQQFGMKAALAAFPAKRSTILLWQQTLKESGGKLKSLIPQSSRPHKCRGMKTNPLVLAELCRLRKKHYRLGKEKIYPLLKRYCESIGLDVPAESTIGKIITRNHLFFSRTSYGYHDPKRKRPDNVRRMRVIHAPKPSEGGYVELDTVETRIAGVKRYTVTAIDVKLKVAYAQTFKGKHSRNALTALKTFQSMLSIPIHTVQTDNGSEFLAEFDSYCQREKLTHLFTYPHSPKINGVVERFNRTIQEDCLEVYYDELDDPKKINLRLSEYLTFYHNERVHKALGNRTPADVIGNYIQSPKGV
jgi:transposase InsO family protein